MLKIIIIITTLLLSMPSFAQAETKNLQADIRGRDCHGGSGLCSIMSGETNKINSNNITIIKLLQNTIVLEFELKELSIEEQKLHFGKEFSQTTLNEKLVFTQDEDFVFDEKTLINLEINPKYKLLKKGAYPLQILKEKIQVILVLLEQ